MKRSLESIDNTLTTLTKRADGIIEIRFKMDDYEVNLNDQLEVQNAYAKLTNNGSDPYPLLVISGKYGGITTEAREKEVFQSKPFQSITAMALVVNSISQRLLGRMYMKLKKNKAQYPYQFFKTEEQAREWLATEQKLGVAG